MKALLYCLTLAGACLLLQCDRADDPTLPVCVDSSPTCLVGDEPDVLSDACRDNWTCSFLVRPAARVDLAADLGVAPGLRTVLQMVNRTEGHPGIADDEFTNVLVVEVPAGRRSFSADDGGLADLKIFYRSICYCANSAFVPVSSGCLRGELQADGSWSVQGSLLIDYDSYEQAVYVDARFRN